MDYLFDSLARNPTVHMAYPHSSSYSLDVFNTSTDLTLQTDYSSEGTQLPEGRKSALQPTVDGATENQDFSCSSDSAAISAPKYGKRGRTEDGDTSRRRRKTKQIEAGYEEPFAHSDAPEQQQQQSETSKRPKKRGPKKKPLTREREVRLKNRRVRANARERSRMHGLNHALELLRRHVPTFSSTQRLSKIETLRLAKNYIRSLRESLTRSEPLTTLELACILTDGLSQNTSNLVATTLQVSPRALIQLQRRQSSSSEGTDMIKPYWSLNTSSQNLTEPEEESKLSCPATRQSINSSYYDSNMVRPAAKIVAIRGLEKPAVSNVFADVASESCCANFSVHSVSESTNTITNSPRSQNHYLRPTTVISASSLTGNSQPEPCSENCFFTRLQSDRQFIPCTSTSPATAPAFSMNSLARSDYSALPFAKESSPYFSGPTCYVYPNSYPIQFQDYFSHLH